MIKLTDLTFDLVDRLDKGELLFIEGGSVVYNNPDGPPQPANNGNGVCQGGSNNAGGVCQGGPNNSGGLCHGGPNNGNGRCGPQ